VQVAYAGGIGATGVALTPPAPKRPRYSGDNSLVKSPPSVDKTLSTSSEEACHAQALYAIGRRKAALNAWYWVVNFSRRGQTHYRRFYDLQHGGSEQALTAAVAWRDRELAVAAVLMYREFHSQRRSNNTSGVAGVHFLHNTRQPDGFWQAKIKLPDGTKLTKTFAVRKFGRTEAFKRAVAARDEMLALVGDRPYIHDPVAKRFFAEQPRRRTSSSSTSTRKAT
jgi:hypothetical protein